MKKLDYKERRKARRYDVDLPLEYRVPKTRSRHGALTVNMSELGLLILSLKDMPVGTKLSIGVLFPKEYRLANFEALGEIVWKDLFWNGPWRGFQYGIKFVGMREKDYRELKPILGDPSR